MFSANGISHSKSAAVLCLLALAYATAPTSAAGRQSGVPNLQAAIERNPGRGLRITEVWEGSAAQRLRKVLPDKYEEKRFQFDAVEAYALVKNNERERAQQLVMKWKGTDRIEGKLSRYWGIYPGGSEVVKNWKELTQD